MSRRSTTAERPPGADADSPREIPAQGWKQVVKRAFKESGNDHVNLLAAGVAFYAFLAIFPAIIAAVSLYGLIADPAQVQTQIASVAQGLPQEAQKMLTSQVKSIASQPSGGLQLSLVISVLAALWSASAGTQGLIQAVNVCYDEEDTRGFVKGKALALALTLGAIVFVAVAVGLIAVLPAVLNFLQLGSFATVLVQIVRYLGLLVAFAVALAVVYRVAPDRDAPQMVWVSTGAVVATVLWVIASIGFSIYANNFGSYNETYGALAGVVVLLFWLFITSYLILLGAEINSETELQTGQDTTTGPEKPMGDRDAVKADHVASPPKG